MVESCGMGSRWRVLTRLPALVSGLVLLAAPGTTVLAGEVAPPVGTAAAPMSSGRTVDEVASTDPVTLLPASGGGTASEEVVVGVGALPGGVSAVWGAGPTSGSRRGAVVVAGAAGRLLTAGADLARGPEVAGLCPAGEGDCIPSPVALPDLAALPSPVDAPTPSSATDRISAPPPPQPTPGMRSAPTTPVGSGGCALQVGGGIGTGGVGAGIDCGPVVPPLALERGWGRGSTRPVATPRPTGCSSRCPARLELEEPLAAAGVDDGEAVRRHGQAPASDRPAPASPPSAPPPLLASTGSPLAAGLAGALMVTFGGLLTWRRARR
ncbi:MAG TPA: hypothetical protein VFD01_12820 [Candidatus Dormibacteraeota bacterium]|nr:hypothetical protein [Candidatus Dormibacteraeota bacterium]